MITCKDGKCDGHGDICCRDCLDYGDCGWRCPKDHVNCGQSEGAPSTEIIQFQSKALLMMQTIVNLDHQKKILEERDKAVRKQLQDAMAEYGVMKFENDLLKITYVEPTTRTTIDTARLKKELPAVAEKYSKVSQVKGSVRIEVK